MAQITDSPVMLQHACVVRNSFLELVDDVSPMVPLRSRRPSSLPPCASFDPARAGRSRLESYDIKPLQGAQSNSECSTRGHSPSSNRSCDEKSELVLQSSERVGDMERSVAVAKVRSDAGLAPPLTPGLVPAQYHYLLNTNSVQHPVNSAHKQYNARRSDIGKAQVGVASYSDVSTAEGSASEGEAPADKADCQLIWCDPRAFKDASLPLKLQLEQESGLQVKVHKGAEKCIRPIRKREKSQKQIRCVILVSASNAAELLGYIQESPHVTARVIMFCDRVQKQQLHAFEMLAKSSPLVAGCVYSWRDAVEAVKQAVHNLR